MPQSAMPGRARAVLASAAIAFACAADARAEDSAVEAAAKALMRPVCHDTAAREKLGRDITEKGGEYEQRAGKWDLDITCEQLDLSDRPVHDTADMADEATHHDWIYDARWSPDGKTIVTAGRDKSVRIWDVATGRSVLRISIGALPPNMNERDPGIVRSARFIDGGRAIIVTADAHPIRIFDVASGNAIAEVPFKPADPTWSLPPFIETTAGGLVVLAGYGGDIVAYDVKAKAERYRVPGAKRDYPRIAVSDAAGLLAVALPGKDRSAPPRELKAHLQVLSLDTGKPLWDAEVEGGLTAGALAFSRDGKLLAIDVGGRVHVYSVADKRPVTSFVVHPYFASSHLAFTADGRGLMSGLRHAMLWDVATGKRLHHFGPFSDLCHAIDVSPDGKSIVTGHIGSDGRIWDIATGTFERRLGKNVRPPG